MFVSRSKKSEYFVETFSKEKKDSAKRKMICVCLFKEMVSCAYTAFRSPTLAFYKPALRDNEKKVENLLIEFSSSFSIHSLNDTHNMLSN